MAQLSLRGKKKKEKERKEKKKQNTSRLTLWLTRAEGEEKEENEGRIEGEKKGKIEKLEGKKRTEGNDEEKGGRRLRLLTDIYICLLQVCNIVRSCKCII